MGKHTKADDWKFAGILSLGASVGLAAGGWVFTFKSMKAAYQEDFVMLGVGVGTPGLSLEISLPSFVEADLTWSPITSLRPFSASELHCCSGAIGTYGLSAGFGYSCLYATAGLFQTPAGKKSLPAPISTQASPGYPASILNPQGNSGSPFTMKNAGLSGFASTGQSGVKYSPNSPLTGNLPKQSISPNRSVAINSGKSKEVEGGVLFRNQVNDGLGVMKDIELERAAKTGVDGLMEAAGKTGRRFKPAISAGATGVVGMWFGIGSVVMESFAAAGYFGVSVLAGGLVQAGEALISGRGIAVMRKFADGYAMRLADMTGPGSAITNEHYNRLKNLDWKSELMTSGQKYVDNGSRAVGEFDRIYLAGEAAVLQAVHRWVNSAGEDAWHAARKKHRATWGEDEAARRRIYEQALYRQITNKSAVGFKPENQFLP